MGTNWDGCSKAMIASNKSPFFQPKSIDIFSYFSTKTYMLWVLIRSALLSLLMRTHIRFVLEKQEKYSFDTKAGTINQITD